MPMTEEMVDMGFSGIVSLEHESHESRSGMQEEVSRRRIACRDRSGACLEVVLVKVNHPLRRTRVAVESRTPLDKASYASLVAQRGVLDDEAFRRAREARRLAAVAARNELGRLTPNCPQCGAAMVRRTNGRSGNPFWGCSTFAHAGCRGTREISTLQASLFDRLDRTISAAR